MKNGWRAVASGQNVKTLVKYDDFRIVLIALKAHARIPGHQAEGRISVHTVRGHIRMRALARTFDLPAGSLLALDQGLAHDVEALEDSAFLLTIARPGRDGTRDGWKRVEVSQPRNGSGDVPSV